MRRYSGREEAKGKLKRCERNRTASDVAVAPERDPYRTRTDLTVSERYLIVAEGEVQAPDKHDFFVDHIFHVAAGPAALVETRKASAALSRSVNRFLRYIAFHRFLNLVGFPRLLASRKPHYPYYLVAMQSSCFPDLKACAAMCAFEPMKRCVKRTRCLSQNRARGTRLVAQNNPGIQRLTNFA